MTRQTPPGYRLSAALLWRWLDGRILIVDPGTRRLMTFRDDLCRSIDASGTLRRRPPISPPELNSLLERGWLERADRQTRTVAPQQPVEGPLNVTVQITTCCNLKCLHCHSPLEGNVRIDQKAFESLIVTLRAMKVFNINISGGEPTLHPDLVAMVSYVDASGMQVTMSTNGTTLQKGSVARLANAGLRRVQISLDCDSEERHDAIRGVPGSFKKILRSIEQLRAFKIPYLFVTTLVGQSPAEYARTIDLAHALGAEAHKTNTTVPVGRGRCLAPMDAAAVEPYAAVWAKKRRDYSGTMAVLCESMFAAQMARAGSPSECFSDRCPAGTLTCAVKADGDIIPCSFFGDAAVGNIAAQDFVGIWCDSPVLKTLRQHAARHRLQTHGCQARAFAFWGKLGKPDPDCLSAASRLRTPR